MLFNSLQFLLFFPLVTAGAFMLPARARWIWLLLASYYFYACWRPLYAALMLFTSLLAWASALGIRRARGAAGRRVWLGLSLAVNLAVLFLYKYYNFLAGSLNSLLADWGVATVLPPFDGLLPVGISFYTFQALSYTIDVYRGTCRIEPHAGLFTLYVSFFPQLVAGPIERAAHLLPQFRRVHTFEYARTVAGLKTMAWGFFKKVVIADRLAVIANRGFGAADELHGIALLAATLAFAYQIYCDFSGYSDIAVGAARILGFDLMVNFRTPYFARSIPEFWQRWHISLSTWFRDYVYIPLGGNRAGRARHLANLFIVFLVSGLWHGAAWTFVWWGAYHGILMIAHNLLAPAFARVTARRGVARGLAPAQVLATFLLVGIGWVLFRAASLADALTILRAIGAGLGEACRQGADPAWWRGVLGQLGTRREELAIALGAVLLLEGVQAGCAFGRLHERFARAPRVLRWTWYYVFVLILLGFGSFNSAQDFIYFQF